MIETERLVLRSWREGDGDAFVRVTNTPAVMHHLGGVRDPYDGTALVADKQALERAHGFCFWLLARKADDAILGLCGLEPCGVGPVADDIEIGWRLREDAWGRGYATEAASAALAWGWANLDVPRIVAITVPANAPSRAVMRRIGMTHRPELDFDHPLFEPGHSLCCHLTYTVDRP